jgi:hypothetical protein
MSDCMIVVCPFLSLAANLRPNCIHDPAPEGSTGACQRQFALLTLGSNQHARPAVQRTCAGHPEGDEVKAAKIRQDSAKIVRKTDAIGCENAVGQT